MRQQLMMWHEKFLRDLVMLMTKKINSSPDHNVTCEDITTKSKLKLNTYSANSSRINFVAESIKELKLKENCILLRVQQLNKRKVEQL